MKLHFTSALLLLAGMSMGQSAPAKPDSSKLKHCLRLSIGKGFDDGMSSLTWLPVLGLSYEYRFSKHLALSSHLLSYYRHAHDSGLITWSDEPLLDIIRGSQSPFLTEEGREALENSGIIQADPGKTIKFLSVPLDVGLIFYPLVTQRHRIGLNVGFSLTYETNTWWKDYWPVILTLEDGSQYEVSVSTNTEFRSISPGSTFKLLYEYRFEKWAAGFRYGNYNVFLIDWFDTNLSVWEASLFLAFNL